MFAGNKYRYKIWSKTDLRFQKLHEEFGKLSFAGWKIEISF